MHGKAKVVLMNQTKCVSLRKQLEDAVMCRKLMQDASNSLQHLGYSLPFWSNHWRDLKVDYKPRSPFATFCNTPSR